MSTKQDPMAKAADEMVLSECVALPFCDKSLNELYSPVQQLPFLEAYIAFLRKHCGDDVDVSPYCIDQAMFESMQKIEDMSANEKSHAFQVMAYFYAEQRFKFTESQYKKCPPKFKPSMKQKIGTYRYFIQAAERRMALLKEKLLLDESPALNEEEQMTAQRVDHRCQEIAKQHAKG